MKIVLVGAGKLATNVGIALQKAGHNIIQVYSRTMDSAQELGQKLWCEATNDLSQLDKAADVYLFAVKDNVLENVAANICAGREHSVFVHTAGSIPLNIFEGKVRHYGVMYPMQTFSKERDAFEAVGHDNSEGENDIPIFIESNDDIANDVVKAMAESISRRVYELSSEDRRYLHLAAVFACNFVNHLYYIAHNLLTDKNIPFEVMLPLIDETAKKVHVMTPHDAQTGPAVRYDSNVIKKQLEMLKDNPIVQQIYYLLSKSIHKSS